MYLRDLMTIFINNVSCVKETLFLQMYIRQQPSTVATNVSQHTSCSRERCSHAEVHRLVSYLKALTGRTKSWLDYGPRGLLIDSDTTVCDLPRLRALSMGGELS